MASQELPLPTITECRSLTDFQCRKIQAVVDPENSRKYKDWEPQQQNELIRLYMTMRSFNAIETDMQGRLALAWCPKTLNGRFKAWHFKTRRDEREAFVRETFAWVKDLHDPATPHMPPPSLNLRSNTLQRGLQVHSSAPSSDALYPLVGESSNQRASISTVNTFTAGSNISDPRFSLVSTNSSFSSASLSIASPQRRPLQSPKHDPVLGLWNGSLRVIPCLRNHSLLMWNDEFPRCAVCGFSQWHALMVHARHMHIDHFIFAVKSLGSLFNTGLGGFYKNDLAGNWPVHFLMCAGVGLDYFISLRHICDVAGQNSFRQNPLHVLNVQDLAFESAGDRLLQFLVWVDRLDGTPGDMVSQTDIHCRTPLQAILQLPFERSLYRRVLETFPGTINSVGSFDTARQRVTQMMADASLRIKPDSIADSVQILAGKLDIARLLSEKVIGSNSGHGYGIHDIIRGTSMFDDIFICGICSEMDTHSDSTIDQMLCAMKYAKKYNCNIHAADESGITPAHLLVTARQNIDRSPVTPDQTAELFQTLLPRNCPFVRDALHVLDPEGNSLIFNIATRGLSGILRYALSLEFVSRKSAMINACSSRPKNSDGSLENAEWSVLQAVQEKCQEKEDLINMESDYTNHEELARLYLERNQLERCKDILIEAGAQLNPSITTRYRICD